MIAGAHFNGVIAGLRASSTFGGLRFSFRHRGVVDAQRFRYAVALNGELAMMLRDGEFSGRLDGLAAGRHRIDVMALREDVRRVPDLHGHFYGRRVWLAWPRVSDADLRGYVVYTDGGTGTVDYNAPVATVADIVVAPRWYAAPDTGTGAGRLTVAGAWTRSAANESFLVRAASLGKFQHNIDGTWSAELDWLRGMVNYLPGGIAVTFEDGASAYDEGDEWEVHVGPRTGWASGILGEGTHKFAVGSIDAAGNVSADASVGSVAIIYKPEEVLDVAVRRNDPDIELSWTLPDDPDIAAVLIYSNYSNTFARLTEHLIEDAPWVTLSGDATEYSFTAAEAGRYEFVVRTRDSAGRISESIDVVSVDTTAVPDEIELNVPEQMTVTAVADGMLLVEWSYRLQGGLDAAAFAIYRNEDPEAATFVTPVTTVAWTRASEGGEAVATFSQEMGPEAGPVYYTVRARTAGGIETTNTDLHLGVPDAQAPAEPAGLIGVPN